MKACKLNCGQLIQIEAEKDLRKEENLHAIDRKVSKVKGVFPMNTGSILPYNTLLILLENGTTYNVPKYANVLVVGENRR